MYKILTWPEFLEYRETDWRILTRTIQFHSQSKEAVCHIVLVGSHLHPLQVYTCPFLGLHYVLIALSTPIASTEWCIWNDTENSIKVTLEVHTTNSYKLSVHQNTGVEIIHVIIIFSIIKGTQKLGVYSVSITVKLYKFQNGYIVVLRKWNLKGQFKIKTPHEDTCIHELW